MNDPWSRSLALLYSPTAPSVQWPSPRCRRITQGEGDAADAARLAERHDTVKRRGLDASDAAVLHRLRSRPGAAARTLAHEHGMSPKTMTRRLLHLHRLGLARADRDGVWSAVDPA
jgi:hypothetical protein